MTKNKALFDIDTSIYSEIFETSVVKLYNKNFSLYNQLDEATKHNCFVFSPQTGKLLQSINSANTVPL